MIKYVKIILLSLICFVAILFVPDVVHPYYYNIKYPNNCDNYKSKTSKEIFDFFKEKSDYTKFEAMSFFVQCNNKNAVPFIFSLMKTKGSGLSPLANPIRIIPITLVISSPFVWHVNKSLSILLNVEEPKTDPFFDENGELIVSDYWKLKIKEKLNIEVDKE